MNPPDPCPPASPAAHLTLPTSPPHVAPAPGLSDAVARMMDSHPTDGSYGFYWPPDDGVWWGTTRDLWYLGALLSPGDPEHRSHCVGLTWEVAVRVLEEQVGDAAINGLSPADLAALRTDWFVREIRGEGAAEALAHYGLGGRIVAYEDVRRGDFLQMWTQGGAGHRGIFDGWVREGEGVVGVRYWSTHPALGGIGYQVDYFSEVGLDPEHFYAGRLARKEDWVPPRRP